MATPATGAVALQENAEILRLTLRPGSLLEANVSPASMGLQLNQVFATGR